jgi:hypothetical protein
MPNATAEERAAMLARQEEKRLIAHAEIIETLPAWLHECLSSSDDGWWPAKYPANPRVLH